MGKSGSDVAKDAATIILLNDNFSAILKAVEEGRLIFSNLRKVIAYQIAAGCWSELIPVLATFFLGIPQPLSSFLMIIISCSTDVLAGIALTNEAPEKSIMLEKPRDFKKERLVTPNLIVYSYLFYGTIQSVGSFINYFLYMSERGPTNELTGPLPSSYNGNITFPIGYLPGQLVGAWNFGVNTGTNPDLYNDENAAQATASSVFFVTLIVSQMGHLLTIRRKSPYFSDAVMGKVGEGGLLNRLWFEVKTSKLVRPILYSWIGSVVIANIFIEIPAVQAACGTGSVPAK